MNFYSALPLVDAVAVSVCDGASASRGVPVYSLPLPTEVARLSAEMDLWLA